MSPAELLVWEARCCAFVAPRLASADGAHDLAHVRRVVAGARRLAVEEGADLAVVQIAAWLHDCVIVPKGSPDRAMASRWSARDAGAWLASAGYDGARIGAIEHAIAAHSFSAKIEPETLEARVVQDADRLDSLGAIGLARCLVTGQAMGGTIYDEADPFAALGRALDDRANSLDHLPIKLLTLVGTMRTASARREAERRAEFLRAYARQLAHELGVEPADWAR